MENFHDGSLIIDSVRVFGKKSVNENSLEAVFSSMSKTVGILWIFKHIDFLLCCESSLETYQPNNNSDVYNRINLSLCCLPDAVFSLGDKIPSSTTTMR